MISRRSVIVLAAAGAAGSAAYALWPTSHGPDGGALSGASPLPGIDVPPHAQAISGRAVVDHTMGDPDAPVRMVEYASFTCPHCGTFHNQTFKALREQYIDTGKVHFTYREVYFDRYGLWAGLLARCADEARYFGMVDLIYRNQSAWARAGDPASVADSLRKLGLQAGLDAQTLDTCMQDGDLAQALVEHSQTNMQKDSVNSTPSFVINGALHVGNMPLGQLGALIDAAI